MHAAVRLRATVSQLTRHLRSQATADSPGPAKFSVLGQLYRRGPLTPTQLALHERVKLQSLTRLLAELEAEGWVARRPYEGDARKSILSLTAAGAGLLRAEVHRREASLALALETQLSADERAQLLSACELIDRVADALGAPQARSATTQGSRS
jgi:DNA-binding MarR family transcriptional regulator